MDHKLIQAALGAAKADLLLKGGRVVNVFSGEVEGKDVLIKNGRVAACGDFGDEDAEHKIDVTGRYLLPGFIDAHIHIESSHLTPSAFGRAVLKHGTCAVVADPHEIANAAGEEGLDFMFEDAEHSPVDIFYVLPSAVPATDKETSGAVLDGDAIGSLLKKYSQCLGLGELMNVPGVLYGDPEVEKKIRAAEGYVLDGHCPQVSGRALSAYASAGIQSDHESVSLAEAKEKLAAGITVFLREGSSAKNLDDLLPLVNDHNHSRVCFCSDDICASDILAHGDIVNCVRKAVAFGIDPVRAVEMGTINAAEHYGLKQRGAIAPGYIADIVAVKDLSDFEIDTVWKDGVIFKEEVAEYKDAPLGVFTLGSKDLSFPCPEGKTFARVIGVQDGQIVTEERLIPVEELNDRDIARLYVLERYGKNGNVAYGLIEGFGLKKGAVASSVAHDSHNLLVLASNDEEAAFAAETVVAMGGGMCVVCGGKVLAKMALPVGGLMCSASAVDVARSEKELARAAESLGISLVSPFMTLAFMALPVIPKLKLTDRGLFDVDMFDFVSLYE